MSKDKQTCRVCGREVTLDGRNGTAVIDLMGPGCKTCNAEYDDRKPCGNYHPLPCGLDKDCPIQVEFAKYYY